MAAKKLIQTIEGATDNTVVYQNEDGLIIAVTRPKIISVDAILSELGLDSPNKKKRAKKGETKTSDTDISPKTAPTSPSIGKQWAGYKDTQPQKVK